MMKKLFLFLLIVVFIPGLVFAQVDTRLSDLTELEETPASSDEFYINDGGTSKKIQYSNLMGANLLTYQGVAPSANAQTLLGQTFAQMQASLSIDDIINLTGMAEGSTHLGTFTGTTIDDNVNIKEALQAIETYAEGAVRVTDWTSHNDYPEYCGDGEYAYGIGDTLLCSTPPGNAETYWTMNELDDNTIYPSFAGYDVVIGDTSPLDSAKFSLKGVDDQIQMLIRGNGTQTNAIIEIQQSDGTTIFKVDNAGTTTIGDGDEPGAIGLKERAAAPADIPGYGHYWVRDDGVAVFTYNEVDYELGGADAFHDEVTLAGQDYLSIDDQEITAGLIKGANINWTTIDQIGDANINWADLRYLNNYINWPAVNELVLTGINWLDYEGGGEINWYDGFPLNDQINWSVITELDLDSINWPYYANGGGINWTTITEDTLKGINWTDFVHFDNINTFAEVQNIVADATLLKGGTMTDTKYCTYDSAGGEIDCTSEGGGGGASTFHYVLLPEQAKPPTTNMMAIEGGLLRWAGLFDAATDECATWETVLYPYQGGTLKGIIDYSMASATANDVVMTIEIACLTPLDAVAVDSKIYGTADSLTGTVPGTVNYLGRLSDASLNGDSCSEFDNMYIRICRDADNESDTATGDLRLRKALLYED